MDKGTRIKITVLVTGLATMAIYHLGFNEFAALLGTVATIALCIYGANEIKSWFKKE